MPLDYPRAVTVDEAISIRLAQDEDAQVISDWTQEPAVSRFWGGRTISVSEVLAKYTGRRAPHVVSYVITEVGRPVGYRQAWQLNGRFGLDMFISAPAQGRGIGTKSARGIATELTALGWSPLTVDPAVANVRALRLWRSSGFVPTGESGTDGGKRTQIMRFSQAKNRMDPEPGHR